MTTTNGMSPPPAAAEAPPDENAEALEAIEAEAKRAGLARLPRRAESRDAYILAVARHKGLVAQDSHVRDVARTVQQLLERAGSDELHAGSPAGRALIAAAAIWRRMNPEIEGVGELRPSGRRGVHVAVAALVRELQQDPARAQRLSPAESELLRFYADELRQAVDELGTAIDAAYTRVRAAAEAELARPLYDRLVPREPAPRQEPVFSFQDTRAPFPGAEEVRDAAGQLVGHVKYGDVQPPDVGRSEPRTIPTPAALRGPRGW